MVLSDLKPKLVSSNYFRRRTAFWGCWYFLDMMDSEHISTASQLKRKKETDEKEGPGDHGIAPA